MLKDLLKLDKLIYKLNDSPLLRIELFQKTSDYSSLTKSSLLKLKHFTTIIHSSKQFNVANGELLPEYKELNDRISPKTKGLKK